MTEKHIESQFADLAATVEVGPPPIADLVRGGRRRLRQRRASVAAVALTACVVLGGTAMFGLDHRGTGAATVQPAAPPSPTVQTGRTLGPLDPFTPTRAMVAQGTAPNGNPWQAWIARWPAATEDQDLQQAKLIWQEQHAAGAKLPVPTEQSARQYWMAGYDRIDLYVVVNGIRQPADEVTTMPGRTFGSQIREQQGWMSGIVVGRDTKDGPTAVDNGLGSTAIVFAEIGPETTEAVVRHTDGSTIDLRPISAGDSPIRWIAFARSDATHGSTVQLYGPTGTLLATNDESFK